MAGRLGEADLLGLRRQRARQVAWRRGPGCAGSRLCGVADARGYPVRAVTVPEPLLAVKTVLVTWPVAMPAGSMPTVTVLVTLSVRPLITAAGPCSLAWTRLAAFWEAGLFFP